MTMSMEQLVGGDFAHSTTTAPKATRALPLFSNSHKTAVVTGAAAGIGLAVAQGLAESGANVALWYHSNEAAHDRAREIEADYKVQCENSLVQLEIHCPCRPENNSSLFEQVKHIKSTLLISTMYKAPSLGRSKTSPTVWTSSSRMPLSLGSMARWWTVIPQLSISF